MVAPQTQQEALRASWKRFEGALELMHQRLLGDITAAWSEVASDFEIYRALAPWTNQEKPENLDGLQELLADQARRLNQPVDDYLRRRPMERALGALQQYRQSFEDCTRELPIDSAVSCSELAAVCSPDGPAWRRLVCYLRRRGKPAAVRSRAAEALQLAQSVRTRLDGRFQKLMAEASLHLVMPAHAAQEHTAYLADPGLGTEPPPIDTDRQWWLEEAAKLENRAKAILEEYREWGGQVARSVADRVVTCGLDLRSSPQEADADWQKAFAFWAKQTRSVERMLKVSRSLANLNPKLIHETRQTLQLALDEHEDVTRELDRTLDWLHSWNPQEDAPFPGASARLVPAAQRTDTWSARSARRIRETLPAHLEVVTPRESRPRWRFRRSNSQPADVMIEAVEGTAKQLMGEALDPVEAMHSRAVSEIERAREVVAFSREVADESPDQNLEAEAVDNVRGLIEHCRAQMQEIRPSIEAGGMRAHAVLVLQSQVAVGVDMFGAWAMLTRQRGKRLFRESVGAGLSGTRGAALEALRATRKAIHWFLLKTGLETPPPGRIEPVQVTRPLSDLFERPLGARELPALYRRLFRLAPLDDIRFLIGREEETQGLREAFERWQAGTRSSAMVIGARGSGKTSLLNCVAGSVFAGVPVFRGSLRDRTAAPEHADQFLRDLLQLEPGADLLEALQARKQVIIIEEIERSYLGVINGFSGLQRLLTLMDASASHVFWVIVMNDAAYQYLNAAVRLREYFSHRISAMSVRPIDLRDAILQRHRLSGLRLEFAPPEPGNIAVEGIRRLLGAKPDAQNTFFEALYKQSEGLFRSAFELWQDSIERVESGVVYMRQPLLPNYRSLQSELSQDDHFCLVSILRHGSLGPAELSTLFGWTDARSNHRIKRLEALELLELDPMGPGYRIRPQAIRFVRESLLRQNLL